MAVRESPDIWLNSDDRPDNAELAAGSTPLASVIPTDVNDDPKDDRTEVSGGRGLEEASVGMKGEVAPTVMEADAAAGAVAVAVAAGSEVTGLTEPHGTLKMMAVPPTRSDT